MRVILIKTDFTGLDVVCITDIININLLHPSNIAVLLYALYEDRVYSLKSTTEKVQLCKKQLINAPLTGIINQLIYILCNVM